MTRNNFVESIKNNCDILLIDRNDYLQKLHNIKTSNC